MITTRFAPSLWGVMGVDDEGIGGRFVESRKVQMLPLFPVLVSFYLLVHGFHFCCIPYLPLLDRPLCSSCEMRVYLTSCSSEL